MAKRLRMEEVDGHLEEVFDYVSTCEPVIVEREGRTHVVIIQAEDYAATEPEWRGPQTDRALAGLDALVTACDALDFAPQRINH